MLDAVRQTYLETTVVCNTEAAWMPQVLCCDGPAMVSQRPLIKYCLCCYKQVAQL